MLSPLLRAGAPLAACLGTAAILASCTADAPTANRDAPSNLSAAPSASSAGKVALCHRVSPDVAILEVGAPALAAHLAHGDYVTTMLVSHDPVQTGDGVHFGSIGDALAAARAGRLARGELVRADCRITIAVSAGTYRGTAGPAADGIEHFPFVVDVPDITLRGALVMAIDANGRATGQGTTDAATTLQPAEPLPVVALSSTPIILANAHPDGSAGHGLTVEGFVFQSGHDPAVDAGGQGVLTLRATNVTIRGNRFEGGFTESLDIRAGSADVLQNHLAGTAGTCDVCLSGPGTFSAVGNHLLAGGIPGLGVSGVVSLPVPNGIEQLVLPAEAEVWADIRNNEVHDHLRVPVGVGIRVDAVGIGAPNVHNTLHVQIRDNLVVNNRFGMIVHAAFPVANTNRRTDVDVSFSNNDIRQSCQAKLLVSLSRHTTALGLTSAPYLLNSTFQLALGGNFSWDEVWYGHPAGFGNTLLVDGQPIANGIHHFYSAGSCPGL